MSYLSIVHRHAGAAEFIEPRKVKREMRQLRRKTFEARVPQSYAELENLLENDPHISKLYGMSEPLPGEEEGEQFFRKALHGPHGTTLVFATPSMLNECLTSSTKGSLDATFKVLPRKPGGRQLLTIHATHGSNVSSGRICIFTCRHMPLFYSCVCFMPYFFSHRPFPASTLLWRVRKRLLTCSSLSTLN